MSAASDWSDVRQTYNDRTSVSTSEVWFIALGSVAAAGAVEHMKFSDKQRAHMKELEANDEVWRDSCLEFTDIYDDVMHGYGWAQFALSRDAESSPVVSVPNIQESPQKIATISSQLAMVGQSPEMSVRVAVQMQFVALVLTGRREYLDPTISAVHAARKLFDDGSVPQLTRVLEDISDAGSPSWMAYACNCNHSSVYRLLVATIVKLDATTAGSVAAVLLSSSNVASEHKRLLMWTIFCTGLIDRVGFLCGTRESLADLSEHRQRILNCAASLGIADSLHESVEKDWVGVWSEALGREHQNAP
jgi:hypothetical protein